MSEGPDSTVSLVRRPHPRRWVIVLGLGMVACVLLPAVGGILAGFTGLGYGLMIWTIRLGPLGVVIAVIATLVILYRRDFSPLRRARAEFAASHPGSVVEAVFFDPLWIPEDAARPRDSSALTYGLVAADAQGLTVIEEGTVILAAAWDELSPLGLGPWVTFAHGDDAWTINLLGRGRALQRILATRPPEVRAAAGMDAG